MQKGNNKDYKTIISEKVRAIIDLSGLEVEGFAIYANFSESHLYAILNGTRDLTIDAADRIGTAFDLKGGQILRANYRIPKNLKKSASLNKFYGENKKMESYFINTREKRKDSYYIENDLYNTDLFDSPVYIWEVKEYCLNAGRKYTSKRLSQILKYMVYRKKLKSKKKRLKLQNGEYGERMVDVFFK